MIKRSMTICTICLAVLFTSGCWDRKELNERALWMATGWDVGKKDNIQLSGQIVVPANMQSQSGSSSGANAFFTISSEGKNVNDSTQNLQAKLSRESFTGHRQVVFFGEEFAKRGLKNKLDANTRGSDVTLRTDVFVVKGATAIEALNLNDPLEKPPAIASIKGHEEYGGRGDLAFVNFLIASNSDGIRPSLPVIEITKIQTGKSSEGNTSESIMRIGGLAVFNKELKLVGYFNNMENRAFLWVKGLLKRLTITVKYDDGNSSLIFSKIKCDIVPEVSSENKIKITVKLSGKGAILENNTNLDLNDPKNVEKLKKAFEKESKKMVYNTIKKAQDQHGQDIFGFGDEVHKKYPKRWGYFRKDWDKYFSEADIVVTANLNIKRVGMSGPSILQEEGEIKK